jgi:SAM-dependent methyltransferase
MATALRNPGAISRGAGDRTGAEFWERWWQRTPPAAPIDPARPGLKNYPYRRFHRFFEQVFGLKPHHHERLIEIGCAQSVFLPYFARFFGFSVCGLDQSALGCRRARQILDREGVRGEIWRGDFFSPPAELWGSFEVACSFGLIEHFDHTAEAVRAVAAFLRPGGTLVTIIPNFTGWLGRYQSLLDREVYGIHVTMDAEKLAGSHREAGLHVLSTCYLMPLSLEVMNVGCWQSRGAARIVDRAHTALSRLVWLADEKLFICSPNRRTSPYIACVARKSAQPLQV